MRTFRYALSLFAGLLAVAAMPAQAAVCHVKPAASGSGASWGDAASLQSALANGECTELWLTGGRYRPVEPADSGDVTAAERDIRFRVRVGMKLYGGFAGTETTLAGRVVDGVPTVLSGDIDGNDTTDTDGVLANAIDIVGRNSVRVVELDGIDTPIGRETVLDGLTITGGDADGNGDAETLWPRRVGGGLYCAGGGFNTPGPTCSPTLSRVTFSGNRAAMLGGALAAYGAFAGDSSPLLRDVVFRGNRAGSAGGAMYSGGNNGRSSPVLIDVEFRDNHCDVTPPYSCHGGAIASEGSNGVSSASMTRVRFIDNRGSVGGAMANMAFDGIASPVLVDVLFEGNESESGGAIYNYAAGGGDASAQLTDVTFRDNTSTGIGGAMYNQATDGSTSSPVLTHVRFEGNTALSGGAMYSQGYEIGGVSSPVLRHVVFRDNAAGLGGAMFNGGYAGGTASPTLVDAAFVDNSSAGGGGGAVFNTAMVESVCDIVLTDVRFSGNEAADGGALWHGSDGSSRCDMHLDRVLFDANRAEVYGGALNVTGNTLGTSSLVLDNVTFSGNSAGFDGGAMLIRASGNDASLALANATFIGNSAGRSGGAIMSLGEAVALTLDDVILWGDSAVSGGSEIYYFADTPSALISHSIVQGGDAGSTRFDGTPDVAFSGGVGNLDTDPLLGPLQHNGGRTPTLLPALDGAAIDAGTCLLPHDQRGIARPQGGGCDIGAVEVDPFALLGDGFEDALEMLEGTLP